MAKKLIRPTKAEDRTINSGIARDPDTFEATPEDLARAKPAKEVLPANVYKSLRRRGERGPQKEPKKVPISLRVDRDVFDAYAATGKGYQVRMNEVLRRGAKSLGSKAGGPSKPERSAVALQSTRPLRSRFVVDRRRQQRRESSRKERKARKS
jgi:uncharacterized protein (DUF4415 family)